MRILAIPLLILGGLLFGACGGSGSPQSQMNAWITSTGYGPSAGVLQSDARKASAVLASGAGVNEAHTICAVLMIDAETANNNLPTPDATTSSLLAKSYEQFAAAANRCYAGPKNQAAIAAFHQDKQRALAFLSEAQARIEAIVGTSISTSTTLDNGSTGQ